MLNPVMLKLIDPVLATFVFRTKLNKRASTLITLLTLPKRKPLVMATARDPDMLFTALHRIAESDSHSDISHKVPPWYPLRVKSERPIIAPYIRATLPSYGL